MGIQARKYELIEQLMRLDEDQVKKLEKFLAEVRDSELSDSLDRSIHQAKNGNVTPHEQVKKKYEKWL